METPRLKPFEATLRKTDEWMGELIEELGPDDPQKAYRSLRATLHALRDRLMPGEVADLAAQMPMLIRGLFLEGWRPAEKPKSRGGAAEFLEAVNSQLRVPADVNAEDSARAVFRLLNQRISCGEIEDVRSMLPEAIRGLWEEACR